MAEPAPTQERKSSWPGLAVGIALTVLAGQLLLLRVGDGLARRSYDLPFPWHPQAPPGELAMVYLDAQVKARLGQPTDEPLDRHFYTQLLERLTRDGARAVLFDILFDNPHADSNVDAAFAEAMRRHGKVVLVGEYVRQWQGDTMTSSPLPPIAVLRDAAAGWGLANVPNDSDMEVRILGAGTEDLPSAGWVAASVLGAEVTKRSEARAAGRWMNYYCEATALRAFNLDQVLETNALPVEAFREKIVVVGARPEGATAGAQGDVFRTPYSYSRDGRKEPMAPGAAVHAFTLLNLVRGDWLTRLTFAQESVLVWAWGILAAVVLMKLRPALAAPAALGGSMAFALVAIWIHGRYHVWFAWLIPAAVQTSVALVWSVGFQYGIESRRRRKLRRAFAAYLSPYMADRIANSDFDLSLGGKVVDATVMFTDLDGFTSISENLKPREVSALLTAYFNQTTHGILEEEGTIIKYMGDAVMALWGAPLPEPRHAERAVIAAWRMIHAGREEIAGQVMRTRIGINSGEVLAGNLGSDFRFDYAAIGDTTNTAARLETLNKPLATDILISEATRARLGTPFRTRALGRFLMAGKSQPVAVHEVVSIEGGAAGDFPWLPVFAQALEDFVGCRLDDAEKLFHQVIQLRGGRDGPSEFYLKQIAAARGSLAVTAAWDGVIVMTTK